MTTVATVQHGDALAQALARDSEWLWLLARGARPRADALERLLEAAELEDAPAATILAGLLEDERGDMLDDSFQPAPRIDPADAVRLVSRRLLPLRSAGFGNCLVARSAFGRHGLPDDDRFGPFAAEEWTARVLRDETGYIVPASVVVAPRHVVAAANANPRAAMRMLGTGTWTRSDAALVLWRTLTPSAKRDRGRE